MIRHDGEEHISEILKEGDDYIEVGPMCAVEAIKQTVPGQPRTAMITATTKDQGEQIGLILQMIPKEQAIAGLEEEERRELAKDLLRELVEVTQEERPQGCELRIIKASDSVTKVMAENGEEMPWEELQRILPAVNEDTLRNLLAAGGIALGMQQ